MMERKSAVDYLRALPEIFTLQHFCRLMDIDPRSASVYLHRWKERQLIESAGDRLGIYFNRLKLPEVTSEHRIEVLRYVYPTAILCGESALHLHGWTTQIPSCETVAVLARPTYVSIHGFEIRGKSITWFRKLVEHIENDRHALPCLTPAAALADLYTTPEAWHPDPDDLYLENQDKQDVIDAAALLNAGLPSWISPPASRHKMQKGP